MDRRTLKELTERQAKNPFAIKIHKELSDYYIEAKMYDKAEEQQEILEYLTRVKRMVRRG